MHLGGSFRFTGVSFESSCATLGSETRQKTGIERSLVLVLLESFEWLEDIIVGLRDTSVYDSLMIPNFKTFH